MPGLHRMLQNRQLFCFLIYAHCCSVRAILASMSHFWHSPTVTSVSNSFSDCVTTEMCSTSSLPAHDHALASWWNLISCWSDCSNSCVPCHFRDVNGLVLQTLHGYMYWNWCQHLVTCTNDILDHAALTQILSSVFTWISRGEERLTLLGKPGAQSEILPLSECIL